MEKEKEVVEETITEKEKIRGMNIYEKILNISTELGIVAKNLKVDVSKNNSYKAVSERDILDAVKPLEAKYRIYSYPKEREIIETDKLLQHTTYGDKTNLFLRIKTTYEFINIDNISEKITTTTYADGIDTGDKATGKGQTYSDKYALMKMYKISTGDDPDKEASPENGYTSEKDLITKEQLRILKEKLSEERIPKMLTYYKINRIEQLTSKQAEELIGRL